MNYHYAPSGNSDAQSDTSSGVSDFVRKRYDGKVPIFGGDARVGAAEFATALRTTVGNARSGLALYPSAVMQEVAVFIQAMRNLGIPDNSTYDSPGITPTAHSFPITMEDRERSICSDLEAASTLDTGKVDLMLSASDVEPRDIVSFKAALEVTKRSALKKLAAMKANEQRRNAKHLDIDGILLESSDYVWDYQNAHVMADYLKLDHTPKSIRAVALALLHESQTGGVQTNRALAQLGDSVIRTMLLEKLDPFNNNYRVEVISDIITTTQSNAFMHERAQKLQLMGFITTAADVNKDSASITSTVIEALYGAVYLIEGFGGVEKADTYLGIVDAGLNLMRTKIVDKQHVSE